MKKSNLMENEEKKELRFPIAVIFFFIGCVIEFIVSCSQLTKWYSSMAETLSIAEAMYMSFMGQLPLLILLFLLVLFSLRKVRKGIEIVAIVYASFRLYAITNTYAASMGKTPVSALLTSLLWMIALFLINIILKKKSKIVLIVLWLIPGIWGIICTIIAKESFFNYSGFYASLIIELFDLIGCSIFAEWASNPYEKTNDEKAKGYFPLILHILLSWFTFGIWYFIWTYRTTKFLNSAPNVEQYKPVRKILLCLFVPFYQIYWYYKHGQRLDLLLKERGLDSSMATLCLIFGIFLPFIAIILMQSKINKVCKTEVVEDLSAGLSKADIPDQLKRYKELLDSGVITEQEFELKKTELLGI